MKRIALFVVAACTLVGASSVAHADVTTPAYPEGDITVTVTDPALKPGESTPVNVVGDPNVPFEAYIDLSPNCDGSGEERLVGSGTLDGSGHATFTVSFDAVAPFGTYCGRVVSTVDGHWRQLPFQIVVNSSGVMPGTGSDSLSMVRLGLLVVAAGLVAMAVARRRHPARV